MLTFTLERRGDFTVDATERSYKCGPLTTNRVGYRALVQASKLDSNGFLVDHEDIHSYMVMTFSKRDRFPSCEMIAQEASEGLARFLAERGCEPLALDITVTALIGDDEMTPNVAGVTAHWRR